MKDSSEIMGSADTGVCRRKGRILGLGVDLCAIRRMDLQADALAAAFTPDEIARCCGSGRPTAALAVCFAAKEAVLKALALCEGAGSFWHDIEIMAEAGQCEVVLKGRLAGLAAGSGIRRVVVAVASCRVYATATALALG